MPYIKQADRDALDSLERGAITPGDLNYKITELIKAYRSVNLDSYRTFNDIVGVLESAKCEFYRRIVIPYENRKIKENGDVY